MSNIAGEPAVHHVGDLPSRIQIMPQLRWNSCYIPIGVLISLAIIGYFWDTISVWNAQARARTFLHSHKDTEALDSLRHALLKKPRNSETIIQLARVHRRLGSLEKSLLLTQSASRFGMDSKRVELEEKLVAVQSGHIRGFEKELPELVMNSGDYGSDIMQAFVLGLFANLRTDDAFGLLDGWESSSPKDPQPKFLQAYLLQSINRLPDATEAYRKGLKLAPDMVLMRRRLAQVLLDSGEVAAARAELTTCQKNFRDDIDIHAMMAHCAFAENEYGTALAELEHVVRVQPNHLDARRLRGQILLAKNDSKSAIADLRFVVERQADDTLAQEALGRALQLQGRSEEANLHFEIAARCSKEQAEISRLIRSVLMQSKNADLRYEIGTRLLKTSSPDDGAKWLRTVLEIEPNHVGAHSSLADYYLQRGDMANAEALRAGAKADRANANATGPNP